MLDLRTGNLVQIDFNLSLPQPGVTSQVFTPTGAGNLIYCLINQPGPPASSSFKIAVYDISVNPPNLVGTVDAMVGVPQAAGGTLKIFGNKLYDGWDAYDISGTLPQRLGTVPFNLQDVNLNRSLAVSGNFAAEVLDVSSPSAAKVTGVLDDGVFDFQLGNPAWAGDLVYQTEGRAGWAVYSATAPGGQLPLGHLESRGTIGTIFDQFVSANLLYTVQQGDFSGVVIYDVSSSPPALVGSYSEARQDPLSLALVGNSLFVGTAQSLLVLDVSAPASPAKVATLKLPTSAMAVSGNALFAGTTDHRLVVLDVSNPKVPVQVAQVALPDFPVVLRTAGTLLFVADSAAGLLTYSISNPSTPILLSQYKPSLATEDVAIDGNLALLAAADGGLVIADISNPAAPTPVSQVPINTLSCFADCLNPAATSVSVRGGIVYLGSSGTAYGGVFGFDYRIPAHPRLVSLMSYGDALDAAVLNFAFYRSEMFVGGSLFTVADRQSDVSQPRNVINLYYPGFPGGSGSFSHAVVTKGAIFIHPKARVGAGNT
jgi:hypothetical protein